MIDRRLKLLIPIPHFPGLQARLKRLYSVAIAVPLVAALLSPIEVPCQKLSEKEPFGVAWRVIGAWRIVGSSNSVSQGDAVGPGALLQALDGSQQHSITILLPDGQRILYECFAARDCDRGFRVPLLYRRPTSTAADLLARVNAALRENADSHMAREGRDELSVPQDEAAVLVGSGNTVEFGGLSAALSDGTYSYVARLLSHPGEKETHGVFEKHGRSVTLSVPSQGLFDIAIYDRLNTPRVQLLLAALGPPRGTEIYKSFQNVEALLKDWNEDYQGWPVHEFRRDYLRSVMLGINPSSSKSGIPSTDDRTEMPDRACEPSFDPKPGVFKADTEVTLQCKTPGAIIRYTVDGSQPLEGAEIYHAPIVVKGTALTIKAFATAEGKKDSPVVTGIFRIGD